jgi:hypothetical protein
MTGDGLEAFAFRPLPWGSREAQADAGTST